MVQDVCFCWWLLEGVAGSTGFFLDISVGFYLGVSTCARAKQRVINEHWRVKKDSKSTLFTTREQMAIIVSLGLLGHHDDYDLI